MLSTEHYANYPFRKICTNHMRVKNIRMGLSIESLPVAIQPDIRPGGQFGGRGSSSWVGPARHPRIWTTVLRQAEERRFQLRYYCIQRHAGIQRRSGHSIEKFECNC